MTNHAPRLKMSEMNFQSNDAVKSKSAKGDKDTRSTHTSFKQLMAKRHHEPVPRSNGASRQSKIQEKHNALDQRPSIAKPVSEKTTDFTSRLLTVSLAQAKDENLAAIDRNGEAASIEQTNHLLDVAVQDKTNNTDDQSSGLSSGFTESEYVGKNDSLIFSDVLEQTHTLEANGHATLTGDNFLVNAVSSLSQLCDQNHRFSLVSQNENTTSPYRSHQLYLPESFGHESWSQAFEQKITWLATQTEQSATLTLNPPELGPIKIVLEIKNNIANASFSSDNPDVRAALLIQQASLRESFNKLNIALEKVSVSDHQSDGQADQAHPVSTKLVSYYA